MPLMSSSASTPSSRRMSATGRCRERIAPAASRHSRTRVSRAACSSSNCATAARSVAISELLLVMDFRAMMPSLRQPMPFWRMRCCSRARVVGKCAGAYVGEIRTFAVRQALPVENGSAVPASESPREAEQCLTLAVSQPDGAVMTLLVGQHVDRCHVPDAPREVRCATPCDAEHDLDGLVVRIVGDSAERVIILLSLSAKLRVIHLEPNATAGICA